MVSGSGNRANVVLVNTKLMRSCELTHRDKLDALKANLLRRQCTVLASVCGPAPGVNKDGGISLIAFENDFMIRILQRKFACLLEVVARTKQKMRAKTPTRDASGNRVICTSQFASQLPPNPRVGP